MKGHKISLSAKWFGVALLVTASSYLVLKLIVPVLVQNGESIAHWSGFLINSQHYLIVCRLVIYTSIWLSWKKIVDYFIKRAMDKRELAAGVEKPYEKVRHRLYKYRFRLLAFFVAYEALMLYVFFNS